MRKRKKTSSKYVIGAQKNNRVVTDLGLINSKALLAVKNYLDTKDWEQADQSMLFFLKEHKKYKEEAKKAIVGAFKYLLKDRYKADPDNPKDFPAKKGDPPDKKLVKSAKKQINIIAKKVWKSAKKTA